MGRFQREESVAFRERILSLELLVDMLASAAPSLRFFPSLLKALRTPLSLALLKSGTEKETLPFAARMLIVLVQTGKAHLKVRGGAGFCTSSLG
jgi:hypothetical protein